MIDFTRRLLDLHISQASSALQKAKSYSYSDKHKEKYQNDLYLLFHKIQSKIIENNPTTDVDIFKYKKHLDFIFKSLEFLASSTLNLIPYEIVECLGYAMNDWTNPDTDKYIIVTSLINNIEEFSYDPSIAFNDQLYIDIREFYGLEFERKLIQINLPRSLSRDYLSAVVLYHELGHFIDIKFAIIESLVLDLEGRFVGENISDAELEELKKYIPFFEKIELPHYGWAIQIHLAEYFCDLFACQYIGEASNHFLSYITEKSTIYDDTHPSTRNRVMVVSDFIAGTKNIIVELIKDAVLRVTKKNLEVRYDAIESNDFYDLLPLEIRNIRQLHGVFNYAWKVWLDEKSDLQHKIELQKPIAPEKIYSIINNLTEKSIGNFITIDKWNKVYP